MHILKVPFSKGSLKMNEGCETAPEIIVKEIGNNFLNESGFAPSYTHESLFVDVNNIMSSHNSVYQKVKELDHSKIVMIGGDHSLTFPAFKAFSEKYPGAGLVVFDAHPDCCDMGEPPSHEDYLKTLIGQRILPRDKVILVGVRNMSGDEKEFLNLNNIRYFNMRQLMMTGFQEICDAITETVRDWPAVYLSIDIDVVDPAFAPGTGYLEPGGLTSRELLYFVQRFRLLRNLKMADVMEVNPDKDPQGLTVKLAAKIVSELN